MCGIIGQLAFGELDEAKEKTRQESMIFLGSELLQLTQERGKDATGVALLLEDGNYFGLKMGIPAIEFVARFGKTEKEYGGFIKAWRRTKKRANVFLGHCRKTSRGSSLNNNNNHPIKVGEILGIHNGTLDNDDKVFDHLKCSRDGQVDSEAIFRLLHHYTKNGSEPFTTEMLQEVGQRISGSYAVLGLSGNNPYQVCAFRDKKPIEMALIKPLKLVIVASEKRFIETALFRYNKYGNLYMPEAKFPIIRKDDVDYKVLQDDSGVIFDLTTKVTAKTELDDLYDWEKIPRTIVKGYEKTTTSTTYNKGTTGNRWNNAAGSKTDNTSTNTSVDTKKKEDNSVGNKPADKSSGKQGTGRVWSKKANKYVENLDEKEVEKTKKTGNVEVDVSHGRVEELPSVDTDSGKGEDKFALEHDKEAENRTITSRAKIEELDAPTVKAEVTDDDGNIHTVEVDVEVDAEAMEKAAEAVKAEQSFEKVEEVLEAFEIEDEETLKSLTPMALANRIRKFTFKEAYARGYSDATEDAPEEDSGAGDHVRRLKALVHMMEEINRLSGYKPRDAVVERVIIEALEEGVDLSSEGLDKIFTAGDDRKSKLIPLVKRMVAGKQNRK